MQKKPIALAIAGFAGSAFAQSNVTVHGVMDATYDYIGASKSTAATQVKNDGRVSANSSPTSASRCRRPGNGLKAVFQTEGGLSNDSAGSWGGSNRDTFVGLTGGFGSVLLGNFTGPARLIGAKVDVNSGATGIGFKALFLWPWHHHFGRFLRYPYWFRRSHRQRRCLFVSGISPVLAPRPFGALVPKLRTRPPVPITFSLSA